MTKKKQDQSSVSVYELEIALLEIEPKIFRRCAIKGSMTLAELHDVIQIVMGWWDEHLHQFTTKTARYGIRDREALLDFDEDLIDERKVKLQDIAKRKKTRFVYEYDFGDGWEHGIEVVNIAPPEPNVKYPVCLAGERACPPEDCGGAWGYAHLLELIANPSHPDYEDRMDWLGEKFDPEAFDLDEVNKRLEALR